MPNASFDINWTDTPLVNQPTRVSCWAASAASWSESDTQHAQNAIALGPFALAEGKFENSTLSCDGMQAIAWIFGPLPRLPANPDPTLKPEVPTVPPVS